MEKSLFSSNSDQWATPQYIFDELNKEFNFTLDPCADEKNHKCEKFFTKNENGLIQDWGGDASVLQPALRKRNISMG